MSATPIDFKEVWPKLRAYTDATGISYAECARRAVGAFIDAEVAKNAGIKEQFEEQLRIQLGTAGANVERIVPHRRPGRPKLHPIVGSTVDKKT